MGNLFRRYHSTFKSSGAYSLAWKSLVRLIIVGGVIYLIFMFLQSYINDFNTIIKAFLAKWDPVFVLTLFTISESLFGLIPPDFFIAWAEQFNNNALWLTILGTISYAGGVISYGIGYWVGNNKKVHAYFIKKFEAHLYKIYRYGGALIVISALFPLPFSMACMAAGVVKYSFKHTLLLGLSRYLRFYLYALFVFSLF